jgi:hypothetical protein
MSRRWLLRWAAGVCALALGVGCTAPGAITTPTAPGSATQATQPATLPPMTLPPTTLPPTTPTSGPGPGVITLAFAGDVHFERHVRALLERPDGLAELRPLLGAADVAVVNLETALTTRGTAAPKPFTFRASPTALDTLAAAGVDVVSMANNHATDFGAVGLADTLAARAASPVPVIGIGATAREAFEPAVLTVRGTTVAVIASTQVLDFTQAAGDTTAGVAANVDRARLLAAVHRARAAYDVVVVFLHWGTERTVCPDTAQIATATALEGAGADVIVGGHQHRVLGAGWLGRAYVGYGLGNFVWWLNSTSPGDIASGVLTVSVDVAAVRRRAALPVDQWKGLHSVVSGGTLTPLTISSQDGIPRTSVDAARREQAWVQARACTGLRGNS